MCWIPRVVLQVVLGWVIALPVPARPVLRYAIFPAPPFMIGAANECEPVAGIDVEIVTEIARRLDCDISYIRAPWVRCLDLMRTGRADLLSSAFRTSERQEYMTYLTDPFLHSLPIAFYFRKSSGFSINRFKDLYPFSSVGVLKGASYFERFDRDEKVAKVSVTSQDQLFPMLMAGRLDIIAGYVDTENYRLAMEGYQGKVERSSYEFCNSVEVFMAISKRSPWQGRIAKIDRIHHQLLKEGFVQKTIDRYRSLHH